MNTDRAKGDTRRALGDLRGRVRYIGGANRTDGDEMEFRDWLMAGNFALAIGALCLAGAAYALNRAKDRREQAALLPSCELTFDKITGKIASDAVLRVTNNGNTLLTLKRVEVALPGTKTKGAVPTSVEGMWVRTDVSRARLVWDLDRARVASGDTYEKALTFRLEADEAERVAAPYAAIVIIMQMGGAEDQERRIAIKRSIRA